MHLRLPERFVKTAILDFENNLKACEEASDSELENAILYCEERGVHFPLLKAAKKVLSTRKEKRSQEIQETALMEAKKANRLSRIAIALAGAALFPVIIAAVLWIVPILRSFWVER